MGYKVKEIYYTLQGEGAQTGRPAVFCRFSGCNLWSGREEDRSKAQCTFCDTDFWGVDGVEGGNYKTAQELSLKVRSLWGGNAETTPYVVCTGGEPLLQLDAALIDAFHDNGILIAVETNGTIAPPAGIDWLCVSPKANAKIVVESGHELKLVYPQIEISPDQFEHLDFDHFYLQPMDSPRLEENTKATIDYCKAHPKWKLSIQTHKLLDIP